MAGYTHAQGRAPQAAAPIEGQIRGLQRMVEDDKYCIDILTQVSAATKALQSFSLGLLDEHLATAWSTPRSRAAARPRRRSARPPTPSPASSAPDAGVTPMNTPSKLGADSLGLVAVFAATLGIGATVAAGRPGRRNPRHGFSRHRSGCLHQPRHAPVCSRRPAPSLRRHQPTIERPGRCPCA